MVKAGRTLEWLSEGCASVGFKHLQGNRGSTASLCYIFKCLTALIMKKLPFTYLERILWCSFGFCGTPLHLVLQHPATLTTPSFPIPATKYIKWLLKIFTYSLQTFLDFCFKSHLLFLPLSFQDSLRCLHFPIPLNSAILRIAISWIILMS